MRDGGIEGAGQARNRVQEDHDVPLVLDEPLGLLEHHLCDLRVTVRGLIERGRDDLGCNVLLHVRDLLGTLVDEQHDEVHVRVILENRVRELLEKDSLTGLRRRDDQHALALADRGHQVQDTHRDVAVLRLQLQPVLRIAGAEIVERDAVLGGLGIPAVHFLDLEQSQVAFPLLGRANPAENGISGAKIEALDLRGRDVNVVRPIQVVPVLAAQETVALREDLQNSFAAQDDVGIEQVLLDAEDQVLLTKA